MGFRFFFNLLEQKLILVEQTGGTPPPPPTGDQVLFIDMADFAFIDGDELDFIT